MKKAEYTIIVSGKEGFEDFTSKVSEKLNEGWKPVGGVAFNRGYPHQAMARVIETKEKELGDKTEITTEPRKALTANEAMKRLDELT